MANPGPHRHPADLATVTDFLARRGDSSPVAAAKQLRPQERGQTEKAIILAVPEARDAGLADFLFWRSLTIALAVAFIVTVPVNAWLISRGRGHALSGTRDAHAAAGANSNSTR
ncbi:DUF4396 domain-containing protein [Kribbella deserti]|uniref:DUF4396 domain-containing protein n=1 Tax=Kribbella deserti TaxID=1926257 RepID=A0ABV6QTX8_9ACTN